MPFLLKMLGYLLTTVVAPIVGYHVTKHAGAEAGVTIAGGVAAVGARILHQAPPPGSQPTGTLLGGR